MHIDVTFVCPFCGAFLQIGLQFCPVDGVDTEAMPTPSAVSTSCEIDRTPCCNGHIWCGNSIKIKFYLCPMVNL